MCGSWAAARVDVEAAERRDEVRGAPGSDLRARARAVLEVRKGQRTTGRGVETRELLYKKCLRPEHPRYSRRSPTPSNPPPPDMGSPLGNSGLCVRKVLCFWLLRAYWDEFFCIHGGLERQLFP